MPLGHEPISASPVSASTVPRLGVLLVGISGVSATVSISALQSEGRVNTISFGGLETVLGEPQVGSISLNDTHMHVFAFGNRATVSLGQMLAVGTSNSLSDGVYAVCELGSPIVQGTFVSVNNVTTVGEIGLTGQLEDLEWVQIAPTSDPNWVEIRARIQIS